MKKWLIIIGSIVVLILLVVRLIVTAVGGEEDEKQWYVSQLHYNFSAEVDSVEKFHQNGGLVYFHLTRGSIETSYEKKLNKKLKHSHLGFIYYNRGDGVKIFTSRPNTYKAGDSISVDSEKDNLTFYRDGKEIATAKISESLSRRPF